MSPKYHFSYQPDWRTAPVAFWVHRPVDGSDGFDPPVPPAIPHKGFAFLHVEFDAAELWFSAPAQLDHFIDVLSRKPLPTSRALASQRGLPVGPNGHWLSRLPATLKSPRNRARLVESLKAIQASVASPCGAISFKIPAGPETGFRSRPGAEVRVRLVSGRLLCRYDPRELQIWIR